MKIPMSASLDIQLSFKEAWAAIDALRLRDIDLAGRRILNAGRAIEPYDLVRKADIDNLYGFDVFYAKLKSKGLNDFPGQLRELQLSKVAIVTSATAPKATDVGKLFYEQDTGILRFSTGSGYITISYQSISGIYAARPSASGVADGVTFYATDQNSTYVVNAGAWKYLSGCMIGNAAGRPTLAAGDVGFRYLDTDIGREIFWDGSDWVGYLAS